MLNYWACKGNNTVLISVSQLVNVVMKWMNLCDDYADRRDWERGQMDGTRTEALQIAEQEHL